MRTRFPQLHLIILDLLGGDRSCTSDRLWPSTTAASLAKCGQALVLRRPLWASLQGSDLGLADLGLHFDPATYVQLFGKSTAR